MAMSVLTSYLSFSPACKALRVPLPLGGFFLAFFMTAALAPFAHATSPAAATAATGTTKASEAVNSSPALQIPAAAQEAAQKKAEAQKIQDKAGASPTQEQAQGQEEAQTEAQAEGAAALPECTTASAKYLKTFEPSGKRDPFGEMVREGAPTQDTSWWNEAAEKADDEEDKNKPPQELRFDGNSKPNHASYARLPLIKVTGLIQVGGKRGVSAIIQNKGSCILYESDNVVIDGSGKTNLTKSLTIKKIHLNGMTVVLDDGIEIRGKFY